LRLGNADLLPFHFVGLSETLARYNDEVKGLLTSRRDAAIERNRQLDEGVFQAVSDPHHPDLPPARADVAPALNFAPLDNALSAFQKSADRFESAYTKVGASAERHHESNRILLGVERGLT